MKPEATQQSAALYPVKDALMYIERHPLGGPSKGFQGDAFFTADNPPYGAVFTSYLKEKIKTKKERRQDAEKDAAKKNETVPYPSRDELRAEDAAQFLTLSFDAQLLTINGGALRHRGRARAVG